MNTIAIKLFTQFKDLFPNLGKDIFATIVEARSAGLSGIETLETLSQATADIISRDLKNLNEKSVISWSVGTIEKDERFYNAMSNAYDKMYAKFRMAA